MNNPSDRKYTKDHEWCKMEGGTAVVGITDFAQHSLTDIVFAELPKVGAKVQAGKPLCVVESVKSVSDVFAPVSGEVTEVNKGLEKKPGLLNSDAFGGGWIAKIKPGNLKELDALMDSVKYTEFTEKGKK